MTGNEISGLPVVVCDSMLSGETLKDDVQHFNLDHDEGQAEDQAKGRRDPAPTHFLLP